MAKAIPYNYSSFAKPAQVMTGKSSTAATFRVVSPPTVSTRNEEEAIGSWTQPPSPPPSGWKRGLFWVSMATSVVFTCYGGLVLFTLPNLIGQEIWVMLGVLGLLLLVAGGLIVVTTENLRMLAFARLEIQLLLFVHLSIGLLVMLTVGLVLTLIVGILLALSGRLWVGGASQETE